MEVDFEDDVRAVAHPLLDRLARGAIAAAMHVRPFDKAVGGNHGVEFLVGGEEILTTMLFLAARRTRGVRHGRLHERVELAQSLHQTGFSRPTRGRHNIKITWIVHRFERFARFQNGIITRCSEPVHASVQSAPSCPRLFW
ncbi:hypothetical protein SDC9_106601 [bioreactor metagenome]|uniref:Uncharacterized protein n=1 Tax=bioreactor metagenome TaxID=1076179 RepID=A0A645B2W7_9ZZZZ